MPQLSWRWTSPVDNDKGEAIKRFRRVDKNNNIPENSEKNSLPCPALANSELPVFPTLPFADSTLPLSLDIGCHRGDFLVALATENPQGNFLGIERQAGRVESTRRKITRLALPNAWALEGNALEVLSQFPSAAIAALHILFPDPWPKRRHAGRRLLQPPFIEECIRTLVPGGLLRIATDDIAYAENIASLLLNYPILQPSPPPLPVFPPTRFQLTFTSLGKPFREFLFIRGN